MSVLNKINIVAGAINELKLAEEKVIEPQFVIISSRLLTDNERLILNKHCNGCSDYEKNYEQMSIPEIINQLKCTYLVFQLCEHDDKAYISQHFEQLKQYHLVLLKTAYEAYNENWISQFVDDLQFKCTITKTLEYQIVKDQDFNDLLMNYKHVEQPKSCVKLAIDMVKSCL